MKHLQLSKNHGKQFSDKSRSIFVKHINTEIIRECKPIISFETCVYKDAREGEIHLPGWGFLIDQAG